MSNLKFHIKIFNGDEEHQKICQSTRLRKSTRTYDNQQDSASFQIKHVAQVLTQVLTQMLSECYVNLPGSIRRFRTCLQVSGACFVHP